MRWLLVVGMLLLGGCGSAPKVKTAVKIPLPALYQAAKDGNLTEVKRLVSSGAKVDVKTHKHHTPLIAASAKGYTAVVTYLLSKGADINYAMPKGATALSYALALKHENTAEALLSHNTINVKAKLYGNYSYLTAAVGAGSKKIVDILLTKGLDVDFVHPKLHNSLILAAAWKKPEMVSYLISKGANVNLKSFNGFTALQIAAELGSLESMKVLMQAGADIDVEHAKNKMTALAFAVAKKNMKAVKLLLKHGAKVDVAVGMMVNPIGYAARTHSLEMVKLLVEHGDGKHNLRGALYMGTMMNQIEIIKYLLSKGAVIKNEKLEGINMLDVALSERKTKILELYLKQGVNIDAQDKKGQTLLHRSISKRSDKVTKLLLQYKADKSIKDKKGKTALDYALALKKESLIALLK